MSITIFISSSHSKIDYSEASDEEIKKSEEILRNNFKAKDKSLARDPGVMRGWKSDIVNFYVEDLNLLPTGLIPYLRVYLKKANIEFKIKELRKFPKPDMDFLNQKEISYEGKNGKLVSRE
jgi:hypothetical protein